MFVLTGKLASRIIKEKSLVKISSPKIIQDALETVFKDNPKCVTDALVDENAVNFLVGQLMKATKGKADPQLANKLIHDKLETLKIKEN